MNIRAVINTDAMTDLGFFQKGHVIEGRAALELCSRGIATMIDGEKRTAVSRKKIEVR